MKRFWYSVVRCVPEPQTGEFINLGAIVGCPEDMEWGTRQVSNSSRAVRFASAESIASVAGFFARVEETIAEAEDQANDLFSLGPEVVLNEAWLRQLYNDHRNIVQLSSPVPILADTPSEALDFIFGRMVIEPERQARGYATKASVVSEIRSSYSRAIIHPRLIIPRADIYIGDRIKETIDFAVANGEVVQIAQAWSFQRSGVTDLLTQVKAWAYAIDNIRNGAGARLLGNDKFLPVGEQIDVSVVLAEPITAEQREARAEAAAVFDRAKVATFSLDGVDEVGRRASRALEAVGINPLEG